MRLLLDTHALIWWLEGNRRLSEPAQLAIADEENEVLVSAASAWEVATKSRLGRLPGTAALARDVSGAIASQDFTELPITVADAVRAGSLPGPLRDPFDRILITQAQVRDLLLVSNETLFDAYGVRRLW
ncbi:MAG: type II toxin-antitoxin system VapC family toxin [Chloroflexi bacterium]|nr:type II toxin-antitoxin system VapC family toxin [Chloroflexota bacterium]MYD48268.1 type II toxin-antitoxin system VapC family toxin [Chloroflexota bacterium]